MIQLLTHLVTYYNGNDYEVIRFEATSFDDCFAQLTAAGHNAEDVKTIIQVEEPGYGPNKYKYFADGAEVSL